MALTQVDQGLLGTYAQYTGFKNRIINGAMVIDQRNAGASVTISAAGTSSAFVMDRFWFNNGITSGSMSVARSTTAPAGFINSAYVLNNAAVTAGAGDNARFWQPIEGLNCADLGYGTANAVTTTLSFWVRSSITGTYAGSLMNASLNRSYVFTYSIASANTWTQISVTIAGDTSGTWATDNTVGIYVAFDLGSGSNKYGTAGSWASAYTTRTSTSVNWVGTLNATFYITGCQLEKGSTATSFDYRPYGTELALCQRYYQSINFSEAQGLYTKFGSGLAISTTQARTNTFLLVKMRTYPSLVVTSTASNYGVSVTSDIACSAVPTINSNTNPSIATIESTVASGLTAGNAVMAQANNNQTAYVGFNAEL